MSNIPRRQVLRGGLAAAAVSATGLPLLQGCSNKGRGGAKSGGASSIELPKYVAYRGFTPDLIGKDGVDNATYKYPAHPVAATRGHPGDGRTVSGMTVTYAPIPPARSKNAYWQELEKRIGCTFDMQLVAAADYGTRFQTAVAGGQLPDLFTVLTGSVPSLPSVLEAKAIDLTPHLSGDAVAKYPFLANIPTASWKQTVYNGKIFGVPVPRGAQSTFTLFARGDLLDGLGIAEPPASLKEFHSLCAEVTKSNTWALGRVPLAYLRQMFQIPNEWSAKNGSLVSALEDERQKDALEAGRKLVSAGVVHPDAFTADPSNRKTWIANGSTLMVDDTFSGWHGFYTYPHSDSFRLASYAPPVAEGGGKAKVWLGAPTLSITSINNDAADRVEALLEVLNYLAAPFGTAEYLFKIYGVDGVHYRLDGTDPVLTDKGVSETNLNFKYLADGPVMIYQAGQPRITQYQYDTQRTVIPTAVKNPTIGLYSETYTRRGAQIGLVDLENDILQGRQPVSAWNRGVAEWKSKGGDRIRDEYQRDFERKNS
ncbi:extracellular solute-binding protein [Streptomyces scopuliridis]